MGFVQVLKAGTIGVDTTYAALDAQRRVVAITDDGGSLDEFWKDENVTAIVEMDRSLACSLHLSGQPMSDAVDHPPHYTFGKFEVIDVIEDWGLCFHLANTVKYIARAKHKGRELEDLKKAAWYLQRKIQKLEGK